MKNGQSYRIHLRAMEPEDLDVLYHIENDRRLWNVGSTNVPYSRYLLHDYIASAAGDIYADRQVRLIAEDDDRQVVGIADLVNFDPRHSRAEVGLVICEPHRQKGFAREVLELLHTYAHRVLHLHQLYGIIDVANAPALALFQSMGYSHVATLPQWLFDGDAYSDAWVLQHVM